MGIIHYILDISSLRFLWNIKVEMSRKCTSWNLGNRSSLKMSTWESLEV